MDEEQFDALVELMWVIANRAASYASGGRPPQGWLEDTAQYQHAKELCVTDELA